MTLLQEGINFLFIPLIFPIKSHSGLRTEVSKLKVGIHPAYFNGTEQAKWRVLRKNHLYTYGKRFVDRVKGDVIPAPISIGINSSRACPALDAGNPESSYTDTII